VGIEKQTSQSATSGAAIEMAASPHKIKYADGSSDMLTINQKNRIVNNREHGITYSGAGTETDADIPEWQRRLAGITFDDNGDINGRFSLDDGEVIPLSERFNEKSGDIRFSLDEEYAELAEDPEGNAERLREMVDAAAKKAGYNYRGFHGSNNLTFSEFKNIC